MADSGKQVFVGLEIGNQDTRYGGFENIDQPFSTVERANATLTDQSILNDSIARMRIDVIFHTQGIQKIQFYKNKKSLGMFPCWILLTTHMLFKE